jgi:hypothetical protein
MKHTLYQKTRWILLAAIFLSLNGTRFLRAAELKPETVKAWNAYVESTEARMAEELMSQDKFLALDFQARDQVKQNRHKLISGEIPITQVKSVDGKGREIKVPDGLIHHWRGSVFIPGVALDDVYARVENPSVEDTRQEDVLDSAVLERDSESLRLFLKLQRSAIIKVVYNTEHQVYFQRRDEDEAWSRSIATKITELENPQTPDEKEKPQGNDRGFLWRLNSYWRYQQVNGGVIVELESITLSRSIPAVFRVLVRPIINKVAHESMERTLDSMRTRLTRAHNVDTDVTSATLKDHRTSSNPDTGI